MRSRGLQGGSARLPDADGRDGGGDHEVREGKATLHRLALRRTGPMGLYLEAIE